MEPPYRAATKLLHPFLSLASLWTVCPSVWFIFFISAATVLRQVVFGRPCFRFPFGVQWIANLVMELASLRSTCPIQHHRLLVMMVSISSCWHRAKRSRLEMVFSQKMRWIFLRNLTGTPGILFPINTSSGDNLALNRSTWYCLELGPCRFLCGNNWSLR